MKPLFLKRTGRKRRIRIRAALVILVTVFILGVILYERMFDGKIEGPATNLAVTTVERMIAEAAADVRGEGAEGGVGDSVEIDSAELNGKRETFEASLAEKIRENGTINVKIPLGTLIGGRFLSGKGPRISSKVYCDYKTECEVNSDLVSVGI
ncbi:MAG: hypothetical protein IKG80_02345, partial [Clostridia bacterium]|nr:hypothetical protein [Clostridia bacterium]